MITNDQLETFRHQVQGLVDEGLGAKSDGFQNAVISVRRGRKFARIVSARNGQESAWGFVDLVNGNILKGQSWYRPHPTPRGNLSTGTMGCTANGPRYLHSGGPRRG